MATPGELMTSQTPTSPHPSRSRRGAGTWVRTAGVVWSRAAAVATAAALVMTAPVAAAAAPAGASVAGRLPMDNGGPSVTITSGAQVDTFLQAIATPNATV
jgi:hypothetical protein